jgi:hypothetical protein
MHGDPLPLVEALDRRGGDPGLDDLVHEGKRHGVVVAVELDVVVDVDAGGCPLAVDEGLGWQRPQGRPVQPLEELATAGPVQTHGPGVQVGEQLRDAGVEGREGEEGLVAEPREDPPFGDQHPGFDLRFIPRLRWPGREDGGAVVRRKLFVGALQPRLIAAGQDDAALELVAHDGSRDAAKEGEGPGVAGDPVGHLLGPGCLGGGVVRGAQDGDEELDREHLAGGGIDELRLLAGVVDETLLAGAVELTHGQAPALEPATVDLAELGVPVPVRMLLEVLEVEQLQGHAGLPPLGMQVGAVGPGPLTLAGDLGPAVEPGLQGLVGQALDLGPVQPGGPGPEHRGAHGPITDPETAGHLPVTPAQGPTSAVGSRGCVAWTVARSPSLPFPGGWRFRPPSVAMLWPPSRGRMPHPRGDHDDRSR